MGKRDLIPSIRAELAYFFCLHIIEIGIITLACLTLFIFFHSKPEKSIIVQIKSVDRWLNCTFGQKIDCKRGCKTPNKGGCGIYNPNIIASLPICFFVKTLEA